MGRRLLILGIVLLVAGLIGIAVLSIALATLPARSGGAALASASERPFLPSARWLMAPTGMNDMRANVKELSGP